MTSPPVAIVTGASRGIGRATAAAMAARGFDVAVGYHTDAAAAEETLQMVRAVGRQGLAVPIEVRDEESVTAAVERAVELGPLTVAVANATGLDGGGVAAAGQPALALKIEAFLDQYRARVTGLLTLARAARPHLAQTRGAIVTLTSLGTNTPIGGYAAIGTAMGGVDVLVRYLAVELAPTVRVNAVKAGLVDTDALQHLTDDVDAMRTHVGRRTPLQGVARPAEIADVVAFLASSDARWITGQSIVVDGGYALH